MSGKKTALVVIATGSEEMEFVTCVDVLRRCEVSVTVCGLSSADPCICSRNVIITPDKSLESVKDDLFDVIVLPGGAVGSKLMCESQLLGEILKKHENGDKLIGAICAAPTALLSHSIALGKSITSYPGGFVEQLKKHYNYIDNNNVVHDGRLITSRGPGTAIEFALKLAELLVGKDTMDKIAKGLLV